MVYIQSTILYFKCKYIKHLIYVHWNLRRMQMYAKCITALPTTDVSGVLSKPSHRYYHRHVLLENLTPTAQPASSIEDQVLVGTSHYLPRTPVSRPSRYD